MIQLNALDVARAAKAAYLEKRLSAQGPTPMCRYRDPSGCPCAIGAAIDDETAAKWDRKDMSTIKVIVYSTHANSDDVYALDALQSAHDHWAHLPRASVREHQFVDQLNSMLPPEERIDGPQA